MTVPGRQGLLPYLKQVCPAPPAPPTAQRPQLPFLGPSEQGPRHAQPRAAGLPAAPLRAPGSSPSAPAALQGPRPPLCRLALQIQAHPARPDASRPPFSVEAILARPDPRAPTTSPLSVSAGAHGALWNVPSPGLRPGSARACPPTWLPACLSAGLHQPRPQPPALRPLAPTSAAQGLAPQVRGSRTPPRWAQNRGEVPKFESHAWLTGCQVYDS